MTFGFGEGRNTGKMRSAIFLSFAVILLLFIAAVNVQQAAAQECVQCECKICHGPVGPHSGGFPGCNACHGYPPVSSDGLVRYPSTTGATTTGAHTKHATSSGYNFDCNTCHYNGMPATIIMEDPPMLQMGFSGGTGGEIYNGRVLQSPYVYDATNGTTVATNGTMTCSNIYCHSNGTSVATGTIPAVTSPSWDTTGPLACNTCHGYPPAYAQDQPKSNTHSRHQSFSCSTCHYATTSNGTQITGIANHANGEYDVIKDPNATYLGNPVTFSYQFDPGGGKCSNVICHGPGNNYMVWGGVELIAGIGWSAGPACNEIRFTGQLNGTPPETFSWNFGDGQTGQGENITHYYAQPGAYQVQLYAIDTNRHSDTVSVPVVAQRVNVPPVPDFTVTVSGLTVTVTDYSTDPDYNTCDHTGPGNILVRWGESGVPDTVVSADLTATRPTVGRTISHTYSTGGNYTLKHGVKDNDPDSSYVYSGNIPVTINSSFSISGKVVRADGITPVATASMRLNGGPSVKLTTTNSSGNYIFTSVSPGSYTVQASKSGLIFVDKPVVVTNASVTGVNFTADR